MKKILLFLIAVTMLNISSIAQFDIAAGDQDLLDALADEFPALGWPVDANGSVSIANQNALEPDVSFSPLGFIWEINLPNKELAGEIPSEDQITPPAGVGVLTQCSKIDISGNSGITGNLPGVFVKDATFMETLNLSGTGLSGQLTDGITSLTRLKELDISMTNISSLPANIGDLAASLETLNLMYAKLTALPESFGLLINIGTELNLTDNPLQSLPNSIGDLTQLKKLYIGGTAMNSLPASIGNLVNMERLIIGAPLTALPAEITKLTKLKSLIITDTQLETLPSDLSSLTRLNTLYYSRNENTTIFPAGIYTIPNLRSLSTSGTPITSIPETNLVNERLTYANLEGTTFDLCQYKTFVTAFPNCQPKNFTWIQPTPAEKVTIQKEIGERVVLSTNLECTEGVRYSWLYKAPRQNFKFVNGAHSSELVIDALNFDNEGTYICKVGSNTSKQVNYMRSVDYAEFEVEALVDWFPDMTLTTQEEQRVYISRELPTEAQEIYSDLYTKALVKHGPKSTREITPFEHGRLIVWNRDIDYVPEEDFFGKDSALIEISMYNKIDTAKIVINVTPVSDKPLMVLYNTDGEPVDYNYSRMFNVKANETVSTRLDIDDVKRDGEFAATSFEIITRTQLNENESLIYADGMITYTPDPTQIGYRQLSFAIKEIGENSGATTGYRGIAFLVEEAEEPNVAPVANDITAEVASGEQLVLRLDASDENNDRLTYSQISRPAEARYFNQNGINLTFKSNDDFIGTVTMKYTVNDGELTSNEATITINVVAPPVQEYDPITLEGTIDINSGLSWDRTLRQHPPLSFAYDRLELISSEESLYPFNSQLTAIDLSVLSGAQQIIMNPLIPAAFKQRAVEIINFYINYLNSLSITANYYKNGLLKYTRTVNISLSISPATIAILEAYGINFNGSTANNNIVQLEKSAFANTLFAVEDTTTITYGETKDVLFSALSLSGDATIEIKDQPNKGTLAAFGFDKNISIQYDYKGEYTPSVNEDTYDVITFTATNGVETITGTKTIHILPKKMAPQIANLADDSSNEDEPKVIDLGITDDDTPLADLTISVELTSIVEGFEYSVTDGILTVTPPTNYSGEVFVEVNVNDPDYLTASEDFILTINPVNDAPTIEVDDLYTIDYNTQFYQIISVEDIDTDNPVIDATSVPAWMTVDPFGTSSVQLTGTPTNADAGLYNLVFTGTDGELQVEVSSQVKVNGAEQDHAPEATNPIEFVELDKANNTITIDVSNVFTDQEDDAITLALLSNDNQDWISATLDAGIITILVEDPEKLGLATLVLEAEALGLKSTTTINIVSPDEAPVVANAIANMEVAKNSETVTIDLSTVITDPDGDALTFTAEVTEQDAITVDVVGTNLEIYFAEGIASTADILVLGSAFGKSEEVFFTVTITDAAPVVAASPEQQSMYKNDDALTIDISGVFTDEDDPTVAVSISGYSLAGVIEAKIEGTNLIVTPLGANAGLISITLQGTTNDKSAFTELAIEVLDHEPVVSNAIADFEMAKNGEAKTVSVTDVFSDEDDALVVTSVLSNSNEELISIVDNGNSISITPVANASGTSTVTLQGISGNNTITTSFTVTITDKAPVVSNAVANQDAFKNGNNLVIDITNLFSDEDDDVIALEVTGISNNALLSATISGTELTIDLKDGQSGTADITVQGSASGKSVSHTFTVTVTDRAPEAASIEDVTMNKNKSQTIDLGAYFTDPDGDAITYSVVTIGDENLLSASINGSELNIDTKDQLGDTEITVKGEADGLEASTTIKVSIQKGTGVAEQLAGMLEVYPNPVNDVFTIQWNGAEKVNNMNISITDISGRIMYTSNTESFDANQNMKIDMSSFSSGIYQIQVVSDEFKMNQRIIKQ